MPRALDSFRSLAPAYFEYRGYYVLPLVGVALVVGTLVLYRRGAFRPGAPPALRRARRVLGGTLVTAALVSVAVYANFLNFHYGGYVNVYEFFHYYLGSKYADEIGYFNFYGAALAADEDTGLMAPRDGRVMDLATQRMVPIESVLDDTRRYRARFSPARWQQWVADVYFFKKRLGADAWARLLRDRGYNATPAWTVFVGRPLSTLVSAERGLLLLALLDVVLLTLAALAVARVFGARAAALMTVFVASSYLMAHVHMKGAFLRTDFVVALVFAVCLLRRGRAAGAGALVGYAAIVRLFPVLFLFGPLARLVGDVVPVARERWRVLRATRGSRVAGRVVAGYATIGLVAAGTLTALVWWIATPALRALVVRNVGSPLLALGAGTLAGAAVLAVLGLSVGARARERIDPGSLRFLAGFAVVFATLFVLSLPWVEPGSDWSTFARKIELHRREPHIWDVGLAPVLSGERAADAPTLAGVLPGMRLDPDTRDERAVLGWIVGLVVLAAAGLAACRLPPHRALSLGYVATFVLVAPTYYYSIVLLLPFLFFVERIGRPDAAAGLVYLFLFGLAGHAFYRTWEQLFSTYYWNSVLALGLVVGMAVVALREVRALDEAA